MIMKIFNMAHWPCFSTVQSAFLSTFFGLEMKKPSISAMIIGGIFTAAQDEHRDDGASSPGGFILKLITLGLSFLTMMLKIYYRPVVAFGLLYLACFYLLVTGSAECDDSSKKSTPDLYDNLEAGYNVIYNDVTPTKATTKAPSSIPSRPAPRKVPLRSCLKSKLPRRAPEDRLTVSFSGVVKVLQHKVSVSLGPNFEDFYYPRFFFLNLYCYILVISLLFYLCLF